MYNNKETDKTSTGKLQEFSYLINKQQQFSLWVRVREHFNSYELSFH